MVRRSSAKVTLVGPRKFAQLFFGELRSPSHDGMRRDLNVRSWTWRRWNRSRIAGR